MKKKSACGKENHKSKTFPKCAKEKSPRIQIPSGAPPILSFRLIFMDKEGADLKLRLIEVLLIIASILAAFKQISDFLVPFFSVAILYFILISDRANNKSQLYKFSFYIVTVLVAALFSATLGTIIGITTSNIVSAILFYSVFTILLFMALSERSFITQKGNQLKKFISKTFQFINVKNKAPKMNISRSDILAGLGIGLAYLFFGIHEIGSEFARVLSGVVSIIGGSAIIILLLLVIVYKLLRNKK